MDRARLVIGAVSLAVMVLALVAWQLMAVSWAASPEGQVRAAWQQARDVGAYRFQSTIVQTNKPLPRVETMGLGSTTKTVYVEGTIDQPARSLNMKLWSEGGSAQTSLDGLEFKVENGKTVGRVGSSDWQEVSGVTGLFAPDNDPLTYLAGTKNIRQTGQENRDGIDVTRFSFEMDGPAFAEHMRGRLEEEMRLAGKLPASANIEVVKAYVDMTGGGETWLDGNGLPVREIISLQFPPQGLQQIDVRIVSDFSGWGTGDSGRGLGGWFRGLMGGATVRAGNGSSLGDSLVSSLSSHGPQLLTIVIFLALVGLAIRYHRSPVFYRAFVGCIVTVLVVSPLIDLPKVFAFGEEQRQQQQWSQAEREKQEGLRQLAAQQDGNFNPNQSPLAGLLPPPSDWPSIDSSEVSQVRPASQTAVGTAGANDSTGGSGRVSPYPNCTWTDPTGDGDNDGLTNGEEEALDTNPCEADTDEDGIPDGVEVVGFPYQTGDKRWYLDPLEQDSDHDGIIDGLECPELSLEEEQLKDGSSAKALWTRQKGQDPLSRKPLTCTDTNRDGTPDIWDRDSDGDGVPDTVDVGATAVITGLVGSAFSLSLQNFTPRKPIIIQLQYRPMETKHLWYTLNVLDWPSGEGGQVTRKLNTRFGDIANRQGKTPGARDFNGDTRLVPMLEMEIPFDAASYSALPVKPGYSGTISATTPLEAWLDETKLLEYGIAVKRKDNNGNLLAYLPANLVRDPATNSPVAFESSMFYQPQTASFGLMQKARLVWLIQSLADQCITASKPADKGTDEWCSDVSNWRTLDDPQVVQLLRFLVSHRSLRSGGPRPHRWHHLRGSCLRHPTGLRL
ncbi:MAG: thrombospondin type 3 repeat-containing protein [Chloroflexi bacterium]|nr:thrombospondin type 3 repeat-containing protein [Chloroflexota bacterium]